MRKLFQRYMPKPESLREHPLLAKLGSSLLHPRLWHLNRHSAAGGVAIGLFCSLIPGPLQMPSAALASWFFRVNLPLALVGTWFSNPFTIGPLYVVAFMLGRPFTNADAAFHAPPPIDLYAPLSTAQAWWDWMILLGQPLLIGLPLLACLLASISYFSIKLIWGNWLRKERQRRKAIAASKQKSFE